MTENPNTWKFNGTVKKLKEKDNKCFICGSEKNIVPHHLRSVKKSSEEYYNENNIVLLCDFHHHKYHQQYSQVNLKTFCEFLRNNFEIHINESKLSKIRRKRKVHMTIDFNQPLTPKRLKKIMKVLNKEYNKSVKVSVGCGVYKIKNIRDCNGSTILEIRGFEDESGIKNIEENKFIFNFDNEEELKLSRFRKILNLMSKGNDLKVSISGELYNILQIKDNINEIIFVTDFNESLLSNQLYDKKCNNHKNNCFRTIFKNESKYQMVR